MASFLVLNMDNVFFFFKMRSHLRLLKRMDSNISHKNKYNKIRVNITDFCRSFLHLHGLVFRHIFHTHITLSWADLDGT